MLSTSPTDRYHLAVAAPLAPLLVAPIAAPFAAGAVRRGAASLALILAGVLIFAVGEQDYLAWQVARDAARGRLMRRDWRRMRSTQATRRSPSTWRSQLSENGRPAAEPGSVQPPTQTSPQSLAFCAADFSRTWRRIPICLTRANCDRGRALTDVNGRTQSIAAVGIAAVAFALAERLAFFTWEGLVLLTAGFTLIGVAALFRRGDVVANSAAYPILFITLGIAAALASFIPDDTDPWLLVLTAGAVVSYMVLGLLPKLRRAALPVAAALLLAAHAAVIVKVPFPPHQDVFRFLNYGVDALMSGRNPYGLPIGADGPTVQADLSRRGTVALAPVPGGVW